MQHLLQKRRMAFAGIETGALDLDAW